MTPSVAVITPFRSLEPHRVKLADWCRRRWEAFGYQVTYCDDGEEDGPFGRSKAVNRGVASVDAGYVIVADADIAPLNGQADFMVNMLKASAPWVIGFTTFRQLTRGVTDLILDGEPGGPVDSHAVDLNTRWQSDASVCGLWAMKRDDFQSFGGFDERMQGWGGEDTAFAMCADTLVGPAHRLAYDCLHLWHPQRADRKTDRWASANRGLEARYAKANGDPDAMTMLRREDLNLRAWNAAP